MKKTILILFVLWTFGCEEKNTQDQNDLYAEWQWVATKMLNGDIYESAKQLDSTYYYNFTKKGILEIKDINKVVKYERQFKIVRGGQSYGTIMYDDINNSQLHFSYSIDKGELNISNQEGFIVWVNQFKTVRH
ncbi:MAG: hypothetical protein HYZ44_14535 [Bacteroidetes bacterium]|nr:hypothetical protein [Bacteroidota bacterium]